MVRAKQEHAHRCSKETEIELLKQSMDYSNKKLDEIYKILSGNGKNGMINEMSEIRGALKFTQVFFGLFLAGLSLVVMVL